MGAARGPPDYGRTIRLLGHTDVYRGPHRRRHDRALGHQGRDGWRRLRCLHREGAGPRAGTRHRRHSGQPRHPQERRRGQSDAGRRVLVPVLAAVFPRPEPHRNGVLKAQGPPQEDRRPNLYRHVRGDRAGLRSLLPARVLELLQRRRICLKLMACCFSAVHDKPTRQLY